MNESWRIYERGEENVLPRRFRHGGVLEGSPLRAYHSTEMKCVAIDFFCLRCLVELVHQRKMLITNVVWPSKPYFGFLELESTQNFK